MTRFYLLFLLSVIFSPAVAQLDSLEAPSMMDSTEQRFNALKGKINARADTLNPVSKIENSKAADSLRLLEAKVDSIKSSVTSRMDSVQNAYEGALSKIQQSTNSLKSKIDSLASRNLPTTRYTAKLDSVTQKFNGMQGDLDKKIASIKSKARAKLDSIPIQPELKEKLSGVTKSIDQIGPQTVYDKLPVDLKATQLAMPDIKGLPSIPGLPNLNAPSVPGLPNATGMGQNIPGDIKGAADIKNLEGVTGSSDKIQEVTGKAGEISQMKSQPVDQLAESRFKQSEQVQQIQKEADIKDISAIKSQDAMKAELKNQARAVATDHFAGKEQQLKAAMDKIAKYKKKFPNASSIKDLPKRPPNAMKGKPLIERIVPGINLQIQTRGKEFMVDFNPYAGYRFSGRITAGLGWNQRVSYNYDFKQFISSSTIFGPRAFGEFRLGKGFCPRAEVEVMNTRVPPATLSANVDPYSRQTVWGIFTGIKKEYKFIGSVKGTASVMVRLYDPKRQSPYGDVVNARIGFEFPMKKRDTAKSVKAQ